MIQTETSRSICLLYASGDDLIREVILAIEMALSAGERCVCRFSSDVRSVIEAGLSDDGSATAMNIGGGTVTFSEVASALASHEPTRETMMVVDNEFGASVSPDAEAAATAVASDRRTTTISCFDRSGTNPERLASALETNPLVLIDSTVIPNPYYSLSLGNKDTTTVGAQVARMIAHLQNLARASADTTLPSADRGNQAPSSQLPRYVESFAGTLISIDDHGTVLTANAIAASALGISQEELIGQNIWELFPGAVGSHTYQQIQRVVRERTFVQFETYSSVLGHWIEVSLAPAHDRIWISIRDISRRKEIERTLNARVRQQAAVAELGQEALSSEDLKAFMDRLVDTVQKTLEVDYVKILELSHDGAELRLVSGVGWEPDVVGVATVGSDPDSQAGYTLKAGGPIIVENLQTETRFKGPALLTDHNVVSGVSVMIPGTGQPYGVLGAHSTRPIRFTQDDVNFVQSVATTLAAAIEQERSEEIRRHYAAIVASSNDAIISESLDGVITGWNAAAERMFGYTADEIIGQSITTLYPEEFRHEIDRLLDDIRHGQRVERHESVRRTKDGRLIDVSISLSPIRDETGRILGASKIAVNITEQKRAELERAASESRLQLALEAGRMGTWDWNLGTDEVSWSTNMELIHGMTPGSFGGRFDDFRRSIHPEDQDRVLASIRQTLVDNEDYYIEYRNLRPDGSTQWLEARGRIVSGGRGRPDHLTGVCTDVTDQVESRQQIARFAAAAVAERDRLQQVVDVIPEGILITDPNGRIVLSNRAARDIWGEEVPDNDQRDFAVYGAQGPDGEPIATDQLPASRALLQGELVIGEQMTVRNQKTGEHVPLLVNSAPIRSDDGRITGAVTTFQDITAFKEFDRQKDEFLQTLSHDLKNPLTSVKGNAQFLRRRVRRSGLDLLPIIDRIEHSAVQAVDLIDELLDLTRLQMGRPVELVRTRTDISRLVHDLAEQQASTSRFHRIRVDVEEESLVGHVDEMRVSRVLSNLLNNAIKYSPDNSEIVIKLRSPADRPGWAEIRVIDQGIGIPDNDLPRLFERFRRGSNVEGQIRGSGLGLASSKQIVEQHGGDILVESVEGQGSTFTVLLPLQAPYPPRPE